MIFYFGITCIIAGTIGLFFLLRKVGRPKVTAYVNEIKEAFYEKDKLKRKTHPHAQVAYVYKSIDYEKLILLIKKKVEVGDELTVSFKASKPEAPQMYALKQEFMTIIVLYVIGLALIGISYYLSNQL